MSSHGPMTDLVWTGRVPGCGCLVAAVSGKASRDYAAQAVADMIREGLDVGREDPSVVRLAMQLCTHKADGDQESLFASPDRASTDERTTPE